MLLGKSGRDKFWRNKKVLITGHTGFKGSWLSLFLFLKGARIYGYALQPNTKPSFFSEIKNKIFMKSCIGDIRNKKKISNFILQTKPSIIFHLAAQPLVSDSYENPEKTYEINVNGTINLLEAIKETNFVKSVIVITSDKCYLEQNFKRSFKETDKLGGIDPYSSSKAMVELVAKSYSESFLKKNKINLVTTRAGNVIGGGDWNKNRLIPDIVRSINYGKELLIRNKNFVRPWQHVLDPLSGYINLCEKLTKNPDLYRGEWNFGPDKKSEKNVLWLAKRFLTMYDTKVKIKNNTNQKFQEVEILRINSSKAKKKLNWSPTWNLNESIKETSEWYKIFYQKIDIFKFSINQIIKFESERKKNNETIK